MLFSLLSSLYKFGQLPYSIYFKLFDTKILPIILYGSELWGFNSYEHCEIIHRLACKRFLCVKRSSNNAVVLGDCNQFPLFIESAKRCIKYWLKILKMLDSRYVKLCYKLLYMQKCATYFNWANEIKHILCSYGFGHVWLNQGIQDETNFLKVFSQRLKDTYLQGWYSRLDSSDSLTLYSRINSNYDKETYIYMSIFSHT